MALWVGVSQVWRLVGAVERSKPLGKCVCSALLGALRVEMLQNVAVAKEWLVFIKQSCCGSGSGGVPLPFGHHSNFLFQNLHM